MTYSNATIYFMSGTGNSFRAATWMTEAARRSGADARLLPIGKQRPDQGAEQGAQRLLGLVFPTHAFTAPWPVLRLACRLPRGGGTHAFVVPTRAGTKFGRLFLLQYAYIILSIAITYLVFSILIRIPLVNKLFTYTTLVHYYRRYHEPDTASDDLNAER